MRLDNKMPVFVALGIAVCSVSLGGCLSAETNPFSETTGEDSAGVNTGFHMGNEFVANTDDNDDLVPTNLQPIPADAEIVFSAPWAGSTTVDGKPVRELYVMSSTGENITQITDGRYHHNHFAVSPDRKKIAANRIAEDTNGNGFIDIFDKKTLWILDLENDVQWPLLEQYDAGWGGVDWSPDGQWVYLSLTVNYSLDIHRVRPDGSDLQNITAGIEFAFGATQSGKWVSDTSVSFDGQWITFIYAPREGTGFREKTVVAVCRVDGSEPHIVTDGGPLPPQKFGPFHAGDFDPEFSPDGKQVVFQRATGLATTYGGMTSHDIVIADIANGQVLQQISPNGNLSAHGISDWAADGRIVFTDWNKADSFIGPVIVNADGSDYHRLSAVPFDAGWNRWIPPLHN